MIGETGSCRRLHQRPRQMRQQRLRHLPSVHHRPERNTDAFVRRLDELRRGLGPGAFHTKPESGLPEEHDRHAIHTRRRRTVRMGKVNRNANCWASNSGPWPFLRGQQPEMASASQRVQRKPIRVHSPHRRSSNIMGHANCSAMGLACRGEAVSAEPFRQHSPTPSPISAPATASRAPMTVGTRSWRALRRQDMVRFEPLKEGRRCFT